MSSTIEGYKNTEVGVIPNDWEVKTLGEVGEVKMCKRVFNNETKSTGTIPFYKIGTFGKEADAYISEDLYNNYRQRFSYPNKGDILISAAGTIGRTLIFDGKPSYFQDSNIVWIDNNESQISQKLLYHVFQVVKYNTEGGTIQRLYNSILKSTKFVCPPTKAEQTAIATALNDADALITLLEKLIAKKKAMKKGAMQELLKPKEGWSIESLGKYVSISSGESPSKFDFVDYGTPYFKVEQLNNSEKYIQESIYHTYSKNKIQKGSVIFPKRGASIFLNKIRILREDSYMDTNLMTLTVNDKLNNEFLYYQLSYIGLDYIADTTSIPQINNKHIIPFLIPIPKSFDEQIKIVQILSDMDIEILKLEGKLEKQKQLKQGMMQSLLTGKIRLV
jgi:type I restriction enzyme S subunit